MIALAKIPYNQDISFILVVVSFLLISLIKGVYWKHAKLFFMGVFAQRYANQYLREENAFTERVDLITFLLMCVNFTLLIAKLQSVMDMLSMVLVFSLVVLYFLVKIALIQILGFLFKVQDLAKLARFFSFIFDKTLGFILFPLAVMSYFFVFDITFAVLIISFSFFIILLILKLFWLWEIGTNSFGLSNFYIFLYLCVLEIFPLLLLARGIIY